MGVALTSCTVPHAGKPTLRARGGRDGDRHRHPRRARPRTASRWRPRRRDHRTARWTRSSRTCRFEPATRCSLFVNGMGGTPLIELYIVYAELPRVAGRARRRPSPARWSATTSPPWRWPGCSITVLRLDDEMTAAVGRAGAHRRRCAGARDADAAGRWRRRRRLLAWLPPLRGRRRRAPDVPDRAGRAPSATRTTARTWTAASRPWCAKLDERRPGHAADAAQAGRHDADVDGGRAAGPLYGTAFLRAGHGAGDATSSTRPTSPSALRGRRWTASSLAARPNRATRRWWTRWDPALRRPPSGVAGGARASRRRAAPPRPTAAEAGARGHDPDASPARAGQATWASAASVTRIPGATSSALMFGALADAADHSS